ncbi:TSUP family transporter [Pseudorhodoferax sp.]|uniref:TSUP family transporter n=1 Tax=Pseudorhodoferax sp. TaxID=1993553 RepID=UPI0039E66164
MDAVLAALPIPPDQLLPALAGVTAAYVVFGLAGFGTALVAGPVLAHWWPLATIVPLLALLDCAAAALGLLRDGRQAERGELRRLVPWMALGSLGGAALLLAGRPQALLLALGVFAAGHACYQLLVRRPQRRFGPGAALPFGLVGGLCSALFGSGGFLYAIYLSGRVAEPTRQRVTQSALIGLSTLTRLVLFALAGVYAQRGVLVLAACLLPAMLLGSAIGRRLVLGMPRERFLRLVHLVVLGSGLSLLARYAAG